MLVEGVIEVNVCSRRMVEVLWYKSEGRILEMEMFKWKKGNGELGRRGNINLRLNKRSNKFKVYEKGIKKFVIL